MKTLVGIVVAVALLFLDAVITRDLWWWFMTNTFGIKPLTIAQASGLSLLAGFATLRARRNTVGLEEVAGLAIGMALMWGLGWAIYHAWCV